MSVLEWQKRAQKEIIVRVALKKCPFEKCRYKWRDANALFQHLMQRHMKHRLVALIIDLLGL